jgi:hypothetical protein
MPRCYFCVADGKPFDDGDGPESRDYASARVEATGFRRHLTRRTANAGFVGLNPSHQGRRSSIDMRSVISRGRL